MVVFPSPVELLPRLYGGGSDHRPDQRMSTTSSESAGHSKRNVYETLTKKKEGTRSPEKGRHKRIGLQRQTYFSSGY